jgi:multisubunit Na+/H+ antiporter MnhB subunit
MNVNYLFPHKFKKVGWSIIIPSASFGLVALLTDLEPSFLNANVPAIFIYEFFGENQLFGFIKNNLLNEILGMLLIIGLLLVSFSEEKLEDEYISMIRLESLVWAVYVNYGILFIAILFIYDLSFLWVMIFNIFTVLLFFIVRFNWQISRLKKSADYEE